METKDRQLSDLDKEEDCQSVLKKKCVRIGDILRIHPQQVYESNGLVSFVNWCGDPPIKYLMREGSACTTIAEINLEFDTFGEPTQFYSNLFQVGTKEHCERDSKLDKAGIRRWEKE